MQNHLIVGLGNPGEQYRDTRHNVGFQIVTTFAKAQGVTFRHASHLIGDLASCTLQGEKVFLLLPTTFMNSSGDAVKRCVDYYQISLDHVMVVCDDVALPLGERRMRMQGSDGGHKGLRSIGDHLGTLYYARYRIGVGAPPEEYADLADYVLGRFSLQEKPLIEEAVDKAQEVLGLWVLEGIAAAMQQANKRMST